MERNRIALVLGVLFLCTAGEAAVPLNSLQTFDSEPLVADWATQSAGGGGSSILFPQDLDAAIQTNQVAAMTNVLRATATGPSFGLAQWNSTTRSILTRPAGVAYQVLLGTIQNTSGTDLHLVVVAYDFGNPAPAPNAEDPGLNGVRAYYSFTGLPNSWALIPEFSSGQTGSVAAVISPGPWPAGSLLYLMWADDNGGAATDSAFTIDNFIVLDHLPPPPPPWSIQPPGTNVFQGRTIRLTAVGNGFGVTFQWFKDGQPIDPGLSPSAIQQTLTITNAQPSDSGGYSVAINTVSGSAVSSFVPVNVFFDDPTPPLLVLAYNVPDNPKGFRVIVDKLLCTGLPGCPGDATIPYNWIIESTVPPNVQLEIESVLVAGTNLEFTTFQPRVPGESYRIRPADDGSGLSAIYDLFANRMPLSYSITSAPALLFKQGANGYSGTQDTEIHSAALADTVLGTALAITNDLDAAGIAQGLLRFDNLFGFGAGQLPPGARVLRAMLSLTQVDAGAVVVMHRMLIPWDQATVTWNGFVGGIATDDVEARITGDATILSGATDAIDVTSGVQAWADGQPNHGWLLQSTGTDGFSFASSESSQPPALQVIFVDHIEPCMPFIWQQPSSITVAEGQSFTLAVDANLVFCQPLFQWIKDGIEIPGATNGPALTVSNATLCDAGVYRLRIVAPLHSITNHSAPAAVTVSADIVQPALTRAIGSLNGTNIALTFSKVMNATNVADISHYVLDPPLAVTGAALSPDGRTVTLTTAPRTPLMPYTLRIQDVTDNRGICSGSVGNIISPNPTFVPLTGVRVDLPWDSEWLYSTNNQDATLSTSTPWYAPNLSPGAGWFAGQALFGTETSAGIVVQFPAPLLTPIPPNTNSPPDQITTYFRKQIELPPLLSGAYALCHFIDDGAVFYLDGAEIGRVNMGDANTPVLFAQRATTMVEASLQCFPFSATTGSHLLAVEVHQGGATTSSDILFGVQIEAVASVPTLAAGTSQPFLSWIADSIWELVTSTNAAGPYTPLTVNSSQPLGTYYGSPTNPASFFRLRYKGAVK